MVDGKATILVAEDEDAVRELVRRILSRRGYRVVTAASGHEALRACECPDTRIDLLLTDVIMPRMSGRELSERSGLPTVFMSGYTDEIIAKHGVLEDEVAFVQKPFTAEQLLQRVAEAIER